MPRAHLSVVWVTIRFLASDHTGFNGLVRLQGLTTTRASLGYLRMAAVSSGKCLQNALLTAFYHDMMSEILPNSAEGMEEIPMKVHSNRLAVEVGT